jgi:hypothetical protein
MPRIPVAFADLMVISEEKRYVFIGVSKAATTSITEYLLRVDPTARRNVIEVGGRPTQVEPHITARELRSLLGDTFHDYFSFAFLREPLSRCVSAYHFYRNGRARDRADAGVANPGLTARVLLASTVPFGMWSLFYPLRRMTDFVCDRDNRLLLTFLGTLENLEPDFRHILARIGVAWDPTLLDHHNASVHGPPDEYYGRLTRGLVNARFRGDRELYDRAGTQFTA